MVPQYFFLAKIYRKLLLRIEILIQTHHLSAPLSAHLKDTSQGLIETHTPETMALQLQKKKQFRRLQPGPPLLRPELLVL